MLTIICPPSKLFLFTSLVEITLKRVNLSLERAVHLTALKRVSFRSFT